VANFGAVVSLLPWDRFYQSSLAATHSKAGVVLARMGRDTEAAAEYQRALEIARPLASTKRDFLPWYTIAEASFGMGQISRSAQAVIGDFSKKRKNWTIVCNWYRQSFDAWRNIPVPGPITSAGFDAGDPAQVTSNLAACGAR
jgi:membrane peptidoglycan carboxypeptidase